MSDQKLTDEERMRGMALDICREAVKQVYERTDCRIQNITFDWRNGVVVGVLCEYSFATVPDNKKN